MTEFGIMTATLPDDQEEKAFETDGGPVPGAEVRIVGTDGNPVPTGVSGLLQARGSYTFVGYLKRPELYDVDADGWFSTGDLAAMDRDGYIRIVGRDKDIVNRGGENIPVVEIENVLYLHTAIRDVAIVGMPDKRLGERICAFVSLRPGATLEFEEMVEFLEEQKMSKQYFPERLELIDDMPRTAAGKIQKFILREKAASLVGTGRTDTNRQRTG
jgi:cyclohexanecarboxylate-CoA ligase